MATTMFGHLAQRFGTHPENLATEGLAFVLGRSEVARRALAGFIERSGLPLGDDLTFTTQAAADDDAIPDIVGTDGQQRTPLILEAKFWAGLTKAQPVVYLERLPRDRDGIVVVVAPAKRFNTLWDELLGRCNRASFIGEEKPIGPEFKTITFQGGRRLALVSWRGLLASVSSALEQEGERNVAGDVAQLQGLCDKMDSTAFIPFTSEDLTGPTPRLILQLCNLTDAIAERAVQENLATKDGLRATSSRGWYGRYLRVQPWICLLKFSAHAWSDLQSTPLWLNVMTEESRYSPTAHEALASLETRTPTRLFRGDDCVHVPLNLAVGRERDDVVEGVMTQIREVVSLLRTAATAATGSMSLAAVNDRQVDAGEQDAV